jgi:hypothetical protein
MRRNFAALLPALAVRTKDSLGTRGGSDFEARTTHVSEDLKVVVIEHLALLVVCKVICPHE